MAKYVPSIKGYIADVPEVYFKRCDGRIFHYDELTNFQMNIQQNDITINAGQDLFPVATLPGSSTMDCTCTIGNFDASIFELAAATNFADNATYQMMVNEKHTIDATDHTITLDETPVASTVKINGLTEVTGSTPTEGQFTVDVATKKVTFEASETGDIEVNYETVVSVKEIVSDNKTSAVGTLYAIYPVYSNGDDCTASGIIGTVMLKIFRCRVTGKPSLAGQYKSASTYDVVFSAIKNNSTDNRGKTYSIAYKPQA